MVGNLLMFSLWGDYPEKWGAGDSEPTPKSVISMMSSDHQGLKMIEVFAFVGRLCFGKGTFLDNIFFAFSRIARPLDVVFGASRYVKVPDCHAVSLTTLAGAATSKKYSRTSQRMRSWRCPCP